jgi:hypothetical protein
MRRVVVPSNYSPTALVRGVSLSVSGLSVFGLSAATLGEQPLGEVRLIPQAPQFVLQQFDAFVLLSQTGILVRCRRRKQLTTVGVEST